jgi:hypothetical protein
MNRRTFLALLAAGLGIIAVGVAYFTDSDRAIPKPPAPPEAPDQP